MKDILEMFVRTQYRTNSVFVSAFSCWCCSGQEVKGQIGVLYDLLQITLKIPTSHCQRLHMAPKDQMKDYVHLDLHDKRQTCNN